MICGGNDSGLNHDREARMPRSLPQQSEYSLQSLDGTKASHDFPSKSNIRALHTGDCGDKVRELIDT